jgi:curved DNA-binding protein
MNDERFIDLYEILQVSSNADSETIERVFRHLATRLHPDNPHTGDRARFEALVAANRVLSDPEERAAYDATYDNGRSVQWQIVKEADDAGDQHFDRDIREKILSLMYVQRRRDMHNPGLGNMELEKLLKCPQEHLEFHLWYLREKGWIARTDSGYLAITADGVEHAEKSEAWLRGERLLPSPRD